MCCFFMGNAFWNKKRFVIPSILLSNALDYKRHWYHNSILGEMAIHSNAVPSFYKCICISNTFWIRFFSNSAHAMWGNLSAAAEKGLDVGSTKNLLSIRVYTKVPTQASTKGKKVMRERQSLPSLWTNSELLTQKKSESSTCFHIWD